MAKFTCEEVEEIYSKLVGADLKDIDLKNSDLSKANLSRPTLIAAKLTKADLIWAKYNKATVWPEGFDPEAAGGR